MSLQCLLSSWSKNFKLRTLTKCQSLNSLLTVNKHYIQLLLFWSHFSDLLIKFMKMRLLYSLYCPSTPATWVQVPFVPFTILHVPIYRSPPPPPPLPSGPSQRGRWAHHAVIRFSLKFSLYIVSEAKCVRNWKCETHWWALYPLRETKLLKFGMVYPHSLSLVYGPHLNHPLCLSTNRSGLPALSSCQPIEAGCRFSQLSAVDQ